MKYIHEILKVVIFIISILFSGYFILGTIYSTIFIELQFKEQITSSMTNYELMLMLFGILGILGVLGFRKIVKPVLSKGELIIYLFSSYFLSYFIVKNFQFSGRLFIILILFISAVLFFLLLQITDFFYNFNILYLKKLILKEKIKLNQNISKLVFNFNNGLLKSPKIIVKIIFSLIVFSSVIILTIGLTGLIIFKINQYFDYQNQLRKSFVITKIVPKNTTYAQEVILQGYNFGWDLNNLSSLMTKDGAINDIKLWTDNEIRFIVPLHLKEGKSFIWLEKPENDSSHSAILKSNQVLLNIISRWEFYPSQINYDNSFYPIIKENILRKIKRFLFFKLKVGDWLGY